MVSVVEGINQLLKDGDIPYLLDLRMWETDAHPGMHVDGPQGVIDPSLKIQDSDIFVGMFWNRLGTPTADARSGTEHEIRRAITAWRAKQRPRVMLYFNQAPTVLGSSDELEQRRRLLEFKAELLAVEKPLVWHYTNAEAFEGLVSQHLWKEVMGIVKAETMPASPLRFAVSSDPVHVRSEGMTELLGDVFLECTYTGSAPPRKSSLFFSLLIFLGTQVTSRFARGAFGEEISGDPVLCEAGRRGAQPFVRASSVRSNAVAFSHVSLDDIQPGEKRTFRITNIRSNVAGLCGGGRPGTTQLLAIIGVGSVELPVQLVATISQGLQFTVIKLDDTIAETVSVNDYAFGSDHAKSLQPQIIAYLRFAEGFPNAFKSRVPIRLAAWNVWDVGEVYHSESCMLGPILGLPDGRVICTGLADHGTRLQAVFNNLARGVHLYVSMAEARGSIRAFLVESESSLLGSADILFRFLAFRIGGRRNRVVSVALLRMNDAQGLRTRFRTAPPP